MHTRLSQTAPDIAGELLIQDKDNATYHLSAPATGSGIERGYALTLSTSPVPDNVARHIQFDLPSATRVFLCDGDHYSKDEDQNFWMELVTTRKRTATVYIELDLIDTYSPGSIVEPGLRLVGKFRKDHNAQIRDTLSYVRITAATAPAVD